MTAPHRPAPAHAAASPLLQGSLSAALRDLTGSRRTATLRSPAEVCDEAARILAIVEPWIPLAHERSAEAAGSPSDSARWADLLSTLQGPVARAAAAGNAAAVAEIAREARQLLKALRATLPPRIPVAQVALALRRQLLAQSYAPYSLLSAQRLAEAGGYPLGDVTMALTDLTAEGMAQRVGKKWRIARGLSEDLGHSAGRVTGFLRALITMGAYPPGSRLPTRAELARRLAVSRSTVSAALEELDAAGLIHSRLRPPVVALAATRLRQYPYPAPGSPGVIVLPQHTGPVGARLRQECDEARDRARYHWLRMIDWPPGQLEAVRERQAGVVRHYSLLASHLTQSRPLQEQQDVQALIAYALACATIAQPEPLSQQLWRLAVLCTAVTDLQDVLPDEGSPS
ncbi:winged helix-turn-helix domain-containing protein [Streptomyces sp. NPDC059970]|uniref:winged helix-turn-helix domain-containing protein n=1 Tax=Streptomyces sp. NPDC059970 TaxID=3347019 RepID=UPI00369C34E0